MNAEASEQNANKYVNIQVSPCPTFLSATNTNYIEIKNFKIP